jgi:hypothetical protein
MTRGLLVDKNISFDEEEPEHEAVPGGEDDKKKEIDLESAWIPPHVPDTGAPDTNGAITVLAVLKRQSTLDRAEMISRLKLGFDRPESPTWVPHAPPSLPPLPGALPALADLPDIEDNGEVTIAGAYCSRGQMSGRRKYGHKEIVSQ